MYNYKHYWESNGAQGDTLGFRFPLARGTYNIAIYYISDDDGGAASVTFGGEQVATFDSYSATRTIDNLDITGDLDVSDTATYEILITFGDKNPSSSGYYGRIQSVNVYKMTVGVWPWG